MNTNTWIALLSILQFPLFSQTQIAGTINQYAKVIAIDPCVSQLTVPDGSLFVAGDHVLLIQMKGATISTSNSGSFGNINELGSAGFYEKNEVLSVAGNEVSLKYELIHPYDVSGAVQLISIPKYADAIVTDVLTAKPWDGDTGGVLVFEAEILSMQANIDVSGKGFRGAEKMLVFSNCSFLTNADEFHYSTSNWRGSPKGEGIAELVSGKEHGRGAQANGGGGGNDHNSGGGGGGNLTNGGIGGKQKSSGFGCDGEYAGRGGKAMPNDAARIYLGGGGGAGHFDNDGAGSSGGNGGGIAIVFAQTIEGNGFSIISNGDEAEFAPGDGGGGGGAGGTIIVKTENLAGQLKAIAKGGKGADSYNTSDRCNGVGGGGSGGCLISNANSFASINLSGGAPGINTVSSGQCDGPSNGAEAGEDGIEQSLASFPGAQNEILAVEILEQPADALACVGVPVEFHVEMQGNYLEYEWQINSGNGWEGLPNTNLYVGGTTSTLSITNIAPVMDGFQYRCLVTNPCGTSIYTAAATIELTSFPQADFDVVSLGNGSYEFQNNTTNAVTYLWDFGDGNTSSEQNPTHSYADFGDYSVSLTATGPCGVDDFSFDLTVATAPTAGFNFDNTGLCAPQTVQFENLSSSNAIGFEWQFPGGDPAVSFSNSPTVSYNIPGNYDVVLIAYNSAGADTLIVTEAIEVGGVPEVAFSINVTNSTVSFNNTSLNASLGFVWDFGDGTTSDEANPVHDYAAQGLFTVTLTALNECGEASVTQSVPTGALPLAQFSADITSGCNPMTVQFQNQSSGGGQLSYSWEFPGADPPTSNLQNPMVTYSLPGLYPVNLTVTNALGSHQSLQAGFIEVEQSPEAAFSYFVEGYTVYFTNSSLGGNFNNWDFGDGNESQAINPVHDFGSPGFYDVMLTVGNSSCGSAISQQIYLVPSATVELNKALDLVISPNPVQEYFTLYIKDSNRGNSTLRLTDAVGKVFQVADFQGDRLDVQMQDYAPGIYFLTISNGNKTSSIKLVKL